MLAPTQWSVLLKQTVRYCKNVSWTQTWKAIIKCFSKLTFRAFGGFLEFITCSPFEKPSLVSRAHSSRCCQYAVPIFELFKYRLLFDAWMTNAQCHALHAFSQKLHRPVCNAAHRLQNQGRQFIGKTLLPNTRVLCSHVDELSCTSDTKTCGCVVIFETSLHFNVYPSYSLFNQQHIQKKFDAKIPFNRA